MTDIHKLLDSCIECGSIVALQAHHVRYEPPQIIVCLCRRCHEELHGHYTGVGHGQRPKGRVLKYCKRCGEPFTTKRSHAKRRKYCSDYCKYNSDEWKERAIKNLPKDVSGKNNPRYGVKLDKNLKRLISKRVKKTMNKPKVKEKISRARFERKLLEYLVEEAYYFENYNEDFGFWEWYYDESKVSIS